MSIILDNREAKLKEYFDILIKNYTIEQLSLGDIIIRAGNKEILVERKTIADLFASISDGRYSDQKVRLAEWRDGGDNRDVMYIFEGGFNDFGEQIDTFRGVLISLTVNCGFKVIKSGSLEETTKYVMKIFKKLGDFTGTKSGGFKKKSDAINSGNYWSHCLSLVPGISFEMAGKILQEVSFEEIMKGKNEEIINKIANVKGKRKIGNKTANKIFDYIK